MESKKTYTTPELKTWGKVADLTQTGFTMAGADAKGGSALSKGK